MSNPIADLNQALTLARQVRSLLRRAGAPRSHRKAVRLCTSIGGAVRHALRYSDPQLPPNSSPLPQPCEEAVHPRTSRDAG
jgi:hypothetical protein